MSYLRDIKHMLELLLQKEKIDPSLKFYDDGQLYYIYTPNPPDYLPKYGGKGYIFFCGTYGECVKEFEHYSFRNGVVLMSSKEYENRDKS